MQPQTAKTLASLLSAEKARRAKFNPSFWPWRKWLVSIFPDYFTSFAQYHVDYWEWVWAIQPNVRPRPWIGIWPRGSGKSTGAEATPVVLGSRGIRKYCWYTRETQDQADKSVENIMAMLEAEKIEEYYPDMATRALSKYGKPKAWRRNRLWTEGGLVVDAIGLDTAIRGVKAKEQRPDLIVFDDIDGLHDTPKATRKKIDIITQSMLPAGDPQSLATIAIQNLMIPNGIFAQLADGRAEFLNQRIVSGPHPSIDGLTYEQGNDGFRITGGTALWKEQDLAVCQNLMNDWGLTAFLREAQHEVDAPPGGMYDHVEFRHCNWDELPDLVRIVVWVDPAVTATDQSDSMGIQADGISEDGTIYRLWSWEAVTSPVDALKRAIVKANELKAEKVGVETDQGGDTWKSVYREALEAAGAERKPSFDSAKAGAGHGPKSERGAKMLTDYEKGRIVHVRGTHQVLERALKRFPMTKPLDLADAAYWSWYDLRAGSVETRIYIVGQGYVGES